MNGNELNIPILKLGRAKGRNTQIDEILRSTNKWIYDYRFKTINHRRQEWLLQDLTEKGKKLNTLPETEARQLLQQQLRDVYKLLRDGNITSNSQGGRFDQKMFLKKWKKAEQEGITIEKVLDLLYQWKNIYHDWKGQFVLFDWFKRLPQEMCAKLNEFILSDLKEWEL